LFIHLISSWRFTQMKKVITISLMVGLMLIIATVAGAAGPPGGGYWFGATHQNVGADTATVSITAYDSASNNTYPYSPGPLASGASFNVGPNDIPGLPAGFIGSIVTSSDQPLVALVNVTNRPAGGFGITGGKAAAMYSGVDGSNASSSLSFPLAKHNHFNKTTTFYLQNAGSAATTINVVFSFGGSTYPYTTPSIVPGQMVAVDPGLAGAPGASVGAMTMTASQPIAGAMMEHEHTASIGTVLQGSSGFAPPELGQVVYCPTIKKDHFGRRSGLQVQNTHNVTQNVTVTYVGTSGTFVSTHNNLAPGASVTFINDPNITSGTLFSAKVEGSAGSVAGIVNESQLPLPPGIVQTSQTYNCQAESTASTQLSYPAYKENRFGRTTALQIQNVGASAATNVVLTFVDNNGNTRTSNAQTIPAGGSNVYVCVSANAGLWNGAALAGGTLSGVSVTADQPIIAVANEASWASLSPCTPDNGPSSFDKATSNAFNLP
jgi:hypothetical protein